MVGEPFQFGQLVDPQPFVQQKVDVAPRQQGGLHMSIFVQATGELATIADSPSVTA
jgi:hypothetical protein